MNYVLSGCVWYIYVQSHEPCVWCIYFLFVTFGGTKVTRTNTFSNYGRLGRISGVLCALMYNEYTLFSTDVNIYVCGYIHNTCIYIMYIYPKILKANCTYDVTCDWL